MHSDENREVFISVDVETAGPIPGEFSLLTVGACVIGTPSEMFSCQLKPITFKSDPTALKVTGLSLEELKRAGLPPQEAMTRFREWVIRVADTGSPVFIGFNAHFDWSFVNYYFHRYLGANPFGFAALDIKSLYMGMTGCSWRDTRSSQISKHLRPTRQITHNALDDALAQAEVFEIILSKISAKD